MDSLEKVYKAQEQVSSGKKVERPSDDPVAFTRIVSYKDMNAALDQYRRNIDFSRGFLSQAESSLQSVSNLLTRAKELTMQGVSGVGNQGAMSAIATEVGSIFDQVLALANAQWSGGGTGTRYIFSGFKSDTPAFSDTGAYQGDSGEFSVDIGVGEQIPVGFAGNRVFQGNVDIFDVLSRLKTALNAGDTQALQGILGELDQSLSQITNAVTEIGARDNRLDEAGTRLQDTSTSIKGLISNDEDVDMAEAASNFSLYQTALQATIASTSQIFNALGNFFK
jgi:flagellar hook-associated protein 3 FlgL